jgi:hypothetical protein
MGDAFVIWVGFEELSKSQVIDWRSGKGVCTGDLNVRNPYVFEGAFLFTAAR